MEDALVKILGVVISGIIGLAWTAGAVAWVYYRWVKKEPKIGR